jgi:hypothetical protein
MILIKYSNPLAAMIDLGFSSAILHKALITASATSIDSTSLSFEHNMLIPFLEIK